MPVLTCPLCTWLILLECSALTRTTIRICHRVHTDTWEGRGGEGEGRGGEGEGEIDGERGRKG